MRSGLGRMHFAGEHCCYQFVGYMEGALHSGANLARHDRNRLRVARSVFPVSNAKLKPVNIRKICIARVESLQALVGSLAESNVRKEIVGQGDAS